MISKMIDTIKYPAFALKDVPYKVYYNDTIFNVFFILAFVC